MRSGWPGKSTAHSNNVTTTSECLNWGAGAGGFFPHEGKQKVNYISVSWYYGYYLSPLVRVYRVSYQL